jgi:hypothetical protein
MSRLQVPAWLSAVPSCSGATLPSRRVWVCRLVGQLHQCRALAVPCVGQQLGPDPLSRAGAQLHQCRLSAASGGHLPADEQLSPGS